MRLEDCHTEWFLRGGPHVFRRRGEAAQPEKPSGGMTADELLSELQAHLRCGVCGCRVGSVSRFAQPGRAVEAFEVRCHGETEVTEVPWSLLETMTRLDMAPAFSRPLLGAE